MSDRPLVLVDARHRRAWAHRATRATRSTCCASSPGARGGSSFACSLRNPADLPARTYPAVRRVQLDVASPYRRIPFAFPALARREARSARPRPLFRARRACRCPVVVTVHDVSYARAPELLLEARPHAPSLVRGSVRRAARVIAVSEFTRGDVMRPLRPRPPQGRRDPERRQSAFRPPAPTRRPASRERFGIRRPVRALRRSAAAAQERPARDRGLRPADRSRHRLRARRRRRRSRRQTRRPRRDPPAAPDGPRPPRGAHRGRRAAGALQRGARARFPLTLRGLRAARARGHGGRGHP